MASYAEQSLTYEVKLGLVHHGHFGDNLMTGYTSQ